MIKYDESATLMRDIKKQGKTVGLVGGHFDLLHFGHAIFLKKCHDFCDILFVMVHNDDSTRNIKGNNRPFVPALERCLMLQELKSVDYVFINKYIIDYNHVIELDNKLLKDFIPDVYFCIKSEYGFEKRKHTLESLFPGINIQSIPKQTELISTSKIEHFFITQNIKEPFEFHGIKYSTAESFKAYYGMLVLAAKQSPCKLNKVAAFIIRDSEIISKGYNNYNSKKTCWCENNNEVDKLSHDFCYSIHAEEDAIFNALCKDINIENADLYCLRGPCIHCAKLIVYFGIKKVIYFEEYSDTNGLRFLLNNNVDVYRYIEGGDNVV